MTDPTLDEFTLDYSYHPSPGVSGVGVGVGGGPSYYRYGNPAVGVWTPPAGVTSFSMVVSQQSEVGDRLPGLTWVAAKQGPFGWRAP